MSPAIRSRESEHKLRFNQDGTFQISVFSDLHFAENATLDDMTKEVVAYVIEEENIDLVVLNGDLISGEATNSSNAGDYLDEVVSPLVNAGQLWASTYGNHDSNVNLNPMKDIYDKERRYNNSLTHSMISSQDAGITNYYLPVYPHDTSESTPALILWFFDSKGGSYPINSTEGSASGTRSDWVIEWFQETNANLTAQYHTMIPSISFYHIPAHAMREYQEEGVDSNTTPGLNGEDVVSQGSGDTDYTGQDRAFMKALLNTTGMIATFSGHDHDNDWCFKWNSVVDRNLSGDGISMCYGRHTGYGGYGDAARGGRQILFNQSTIQNEVRTWVRLEDGTISAPVTLNQTYGQDQYTAVLRRELQTSGASGFDSGSFSLLWAVCLTVSSLLNMIHL
ncbi:hypothetical protein N7462_000127 [Penicillium macrosclerotiorum]|uniref:uncharacterized protein n=1 Tax=Penicillium macrosclerotiorum TaxID=303699 RepID=UPI00254828C2|nr:uncharacterized protein N7462_000127 [Penicillium macrosclerotiorum]KAJ5698122.1 hypothetical protein N7462_000127 [Penicillium macrosclerotiorum]